LEGDDSPLGTNKGGNMMLIIVNTSILKVIFRCITVGIHYQSCVIREPVALITV